MRRCNAIGQQSSLPEKLHCEVPFSGSSPPLKVFDVIPDAGNQGRDPHHHVLFFIYVCVVNIVIKRTMLDPIVSFSRSFSFSNY